MAMSQGNYTGPPPLATQLPQARTTILRRAAACARVSLLSLLTACLRPRPTSCCCCCCCWTPGSRWWTPDSLIPSCSDRPSSLRSANGAPPREAAHQGLGLTLLCACALRPPPSIALQSPTLLPSAAPTLAPNPRRLPNARCPRPRHSDPLNSLPRLDPSGAQPSQEPTTHPRAHANRPYHTRTTASLAPVG